VILTYAEQFCYDDLFVGGTVEVREDTAVFQVYLSLNRQGLIDLYATQDCIWWHASIKFEHRDALLHRLSPKWQALYRLAGHSPHYYEANRLGPGPRPRRGLWSSSTAIVRVS